MISSHASMHMLALERATTACLLFSSSQLHVEENDIYVICNPMSTVTWSRGRR